MQPCGNRFLINHGTLMLFVMPAIPNMEGDDMKDSTNANPVPVIDISLLKLAMIGYLEYDSYLEHDGNRKIQTVVLNADIEAIEYFTYDSVLVYSKTYY